MPPLYNIQAELKNLLNVPYTEMLTLVRSANTICVMSVHVCTCVCVYMMRVCMCVCVHAHTSIL